VKAIFNGKIILQDEILEGKVLVFDDKIRNIQEKIPKNCEQIDAKGLYIAPGLIDVHIHGSFGADVMDANLSAIKTISKGIAKNGVTSFLPTTMTMSQEHIYQALDHVRYWMNQSLEGAKVLGAHLEGPFINEKYKGAQSPDYMIKPDYEFIKDYLDTIKLITYAPELDIDHQFTKLVRDNTSITLSIGHSDATFKEAKAAFACGCSHVTHLFNAMSPLNHRDPGVVGAALMTDVYCEFIADTIHSDAQIFQFVLDNKGKDRVVLISDSMRAGCMKDGNYDLGGQSVIVKNSTARLECGSLAGSILTLNQGIKHFYDHTDISLSHAIHLGTLNPAKSIGISETKGSLEIGKDADIIILDDELNCQLTICEGRIVYNQLG